MARRREESLVDIALSSKWPVSAAIAVFFLVLGYVVVPLSVRGNPILLAIAQGVTPILSIVAGFFGVIAGSKWLYTRLQTQPGQVRSTRSAINPGRRAAIETSPSPPVMPFRREEPAIPLRQEPVLGSVEQPQFASAWTLELLQSIEWKRFEDLCQRFYAAKGIRSICTPLGPDGGIDIRLFPEEGDRATAIVQCKAWGDSYVGVKPIRELLGVTVHEKVAKAFFMTSGKYSDEAKSFAASHPITLIDGVMLVAMIKRLPETEQRALLEFATAGEYTTPTCPSCGTKMRLVAGTEGRRDFWGCSNFPRCRQKLGARRGAMGRTTAVYA